MSKTIKIAAWNVNSIIARLPVVLQFIKEENPDILLLQELKCVNDAFPLMEIEGLGYNVALHGQKTYNGVAILSKFPIDEVVRNIPCFPDENSRYIEAIISLPGSAIRVASVYVPNGQTPESDKFQYKMRFFDCLHQHLKELMHFDERIFIGGDFNVAPEDIDVHNPKEVAGQVCFHPKEQQKFRSITNLNYTDIFRALNPYAKQYSWWDYRAGAFQNNKGLRIDFILTNPLASDSVDNCYIYEKIRAVEKTSDHAPVIVEVNV